MRSVNPMIMSVSSRSFALLLLIASLILPQFSAQKDTLNARQGIRDGETLVSSGGTYELGFFSPGNSKNRYVGMWYRNIPVRTYVWVVNRELPLTNTTGVVLQVVEPGILVLLTGTNRTIRLTNTSRSVQNPVAQLLDSGNLVVRDANDDNRPENFLWQSFDHPTDTYWAGVKIGWNLATGVESYLSSWRSEDDPAPGDFSFHLDLSGFPQVYFRRGANVTHRIGPWNGLYFSGSGGDPTFRLSFVMNSNEVYYYSMLNGSNIVSKFTLDRTGYAQRSTWVDRRGWVVYLNIPRDRCDEYRFCGANGRCDAGISPVCMCLDKFVPRDRDSWARGDWTNGCIRRSNLSCEGDAFLKYSGVKLPDTRNSSYNWSMTLDECGAECLRNCSCTAYAQLDIRKGIGCLMWYDELIDVRSLPGDLGQDIYIRMTSSEADVSRTGPESQGINRKALVAGLTSGVGFALIGLSLCLYFWKRENRMKMVQERFSDGNHESHSELPLLDLAVIMKATNHFSSDNKLGKGGFGTVYRGKLEGGQEIAVKRLSKDSIQGLQELKNEVILIAKLQHRNLVRLVGCCIQAEERMLIYEYMPYKSLDHILFDQTKSMLLDWPLRFHIIDGIARGLLYLHQDSRLRIIHRDLKASNILLDSDMTPKISDFGIARSFAGNNTEAKTHRVIGTYGYMSPEYAIDGLFSVKSDVFSFGVLVLEIVSGKKNRGFAHSDHSLNLLGHAWSLYTEERSIQLVDASLEILPFYHSEILRSIHVGLLCVQQNPEDRPTMSSVILMLGSEDVLPQAKQPGFFAPRDVLSGENSNNINTANSTNEVTITMPEPR